jgi:hypothetical protein
MNMFFVQIDEKSLAIYIARINGRPILSKYAFVLRIHQAFEGEYR